MAVIWKYDFPIEHRFSLEMPAGAEVIHVDLQHGVPRMWTLCDPTATKTIREFMIMGTGHDFVYLGQNYIGSFMTHAGNYVWHLFEIDISEVGR